MERKKNESLEDVDIEALLQRIDGSKTMQSLSADERNAITGEVTRKNGGVIAEIIKALDMEDYGNSIVDKVTDESIEAEMGSVINILKRRQALYKTSMDEEAVREAEKKQYNKLLS